MARLLLASALASALGAPHELTPPRGLDEPPGEANPAASEAQTQLKRRLEPWRWPWELETEQQQQQSKYQTGQPKQGQQLDEDGPGGQGEQNHERRKEQSKQELSEQERIEKSSERDRERRELMEMTSAQRFVHGMGNGVNINPSVTNLVGKLDFGLLHRPTLSGQLPLGHVRLNGNIVEPLQDWSTCPATTKTVQMMGGSDETAAFHILHGMGKDPVSTHFSDLKAAAVHALNAGLHVVLNPLHRRHRVEVTTETLRWVWKAMVQAFPIKDFPIDRVAFQMVNDPAVSSDGDGEAAVFGGVRAADERRWHDMQAEWAELVQTEQPGRVLFLSALRGNASTSAYIATRRMLDPLNDGQDLRSIGKQSGTIAITMDISPFTEDDYTVETDQPTCTSGSVFCEPMHEPVPSLYPKDARRALEELRSRSMLQRDGNESAAVRSSLRPSLASQAYARFFSPLSDMAGATIRGLLPHTPLNAQQRRVATPDAHAT